MQFSPSRGYQPQQQQPQPYSPNNGLPSLQAGGMPYRNQPDQRVYGSGPASLLVKPSLIAHQPQPLSPPQQQQPRPRSPPGWIQQPSAAASAAALSPVASPARTLQSSPSESQFRSPFMKQPVGGRMQHSHSDALLKTSPQQAQQSRQPPPPMQVNRPSAKWIAEQEAKKQQAMQQQQQQSQQMPLSPTQALPGVQAQSQQPLSPQRQQSMQHSASALRFPNQHLSPQQQLAAQRGANHAAVTSPSRLAPLLGYQTSSKVAAAEMQAAAERQKAKEEHEAAIRREQQQQQQLEQEQYEAAMAQQQQQQQWEQQVQDQLQQQGQHQQQQQYASPDGSIDQQQEQAAWEQQQAEAADRAQAEAQGGAMYGGGGGGQEQGQGPPSDPAAAEAYWAEQAEQERYMAWLAQQEAQQRENAEAQAQPHHWQQPIGQPHAQPQMPGQAPARGGSFSLSPSHTQLGGMSGGSSGSGFGSTQSQAQQQQQQAQPIGQPHTFLSWAPSRGNGGGTSLGTSGNKRSAVHFTSPASLIQHAGQEDERSRFQSHTQESFVAPGGWRPPPPKMEPEIFRSNTEARDNYKAPPAGMGYAQRVTGPKGASSAGTGLPGADYAARMAASFATKQRAENQYTGFGGAAGPPQPRPTQLSPTKFPTLNLRP